MTGFTPLSEAAACLEEWAMHRDECKTSEALVALQDLANRVDLLSQEVCPSVATP